MNESTICAQPFFGLQIKADGSAGICCEIPDNLKGTDATSQSFSQILEHPTYQSVRKKMLANQKPSECWRCYEKESFGAPSLRHVLNKHYIETNGDFDPNILKVQNIEFVLGNTCQLRCIMCHPSRSKNVEEPFKFINKTENRESFRNHLTTLPESFNSDWLNNESAWQHLTTESLDAKRIFFNGGEPLLARQHLNILKKLIDSGLAKDILLTYSTNGFLLSDEYVEIWRHFKQVVISFSIDDLDERNHFIRNPSSWSKITQSLERIQNWQKNPENSRIDFGIWCAINFLNFPYLSDYLKFFSVNYPTINIRGWRAVQTPNFLSPAILPTALRLNYGKLIEEVISENPQYEHLRSDVKMIIELEHTQNLLADGTVFVKKMAEFYKVDIVKIFDRLEGILQAGS